MNTYRERSTVIVPRDTTTIEHTDAMPDAVTEAPSALGREPDNRGTVTETDIYTFREGHGWKHGQ